MNKHILIVLTFIAAIGGLVFYDQVLAFFHGMTPLGAIDFIMTFVLKAVVLSIISWLVYHLPELLRPWWRMVRPSLRQKRQHQSQGAPVRPRAPRMNKDALLAWMARQLQPRVNSKASTEAPPADEARLRFE